LYDDTSVIPEEPELLAKVDLLQSTICNTNILEGIDGSTMGLVIGERLDSKLDLQTFGPIPSAPAILVCCSYIKESEDVALPRKFAKKVAASNYLSGGSLSMVNSRAMSVVEARIMAKHVLKSKESLKLGLNNEAGAQRKLVFSSPLFNYWGIPNF
jgi:hypothetical protein